jgi:hypothetical protein
MRPGYCFGLSLKKFPLDTAISRSIGLIEKGVWGGGSGLVRLEIMEEVFFFDPESELVLLRNPRIVKKSLQR